MWCVYIIHHMIENCLMKWTLLIVLHIRRSAGNMRLYDFIENFWGTIFLAVGKLPAAFFITRKDVNK